MPLKLNAPLKTQQDRDKTAFMDDQTSVDEESLLPRNVVPEPEAVPLQDQVCFDAIWGCVMHSVELNSRIFCD